MNMITVVLVFALFAAAVCNDCIDQEEDCRRWSGLGYCDSDGFREFMARKCTKSCNVCSPLLEVEESNTCSDSDADRDDCLRFASEGKCTKPLYSEWMSEHCKKSCHLCPKSCTDDDSHCGTWKEKGYCTADEYWKYMRTHCPKSCGICTDCGDVHSITKDWTLIRVEHNLGSASVDTKQHRLAEVTVTGGSGWFSASGADIQKADFTAKSGPKIPNGFKIAMVLPVVSDQGKLSISTEKTDLTVGQTKWLPDMEYSGQWNCYANEGETKTCYAYVNEFHLTSQCTLTWEDPGKRCSVQTSAELKQQLWGHPIIVD